MARKPVSQMTEAEREEYRAYMRNAKAKSRSKRKPGECLSCGGATPKRNGRQLATCDTCNARSRAHDASKGFPIRPSVFIKRQAVSMANDDMSVDEIAKVLNVDKERIREVLDREGLL